MKKDIKAQRIDEIKGLFEKNGTYYLFNYNKMTVAQATALRKNLRKQGSALKIVKNRLALRSVPEPLAGDLKPVFRTPTAVAYTDGDAVALAKALKEFQVANKVLALKGGVVEGIFIGPERFDEIVRLPGRMDLLARVGGLMAAPLSGFLRCLQAPMGSFGILLNQLKNKKETA
ncbi:MAG: 50S ribosomal protein L10 [Candidatus Aminicenantes bacterium]|nr:50S ribosomal protein L10 [Candidatus Aminicenantes bacterium]